MLLSKLIAYLNHLDSMDPSSARDEVRACLLPQVHTIQNHDIKFSNLAQQLEGSYNKVQSGIDQFVEIVDQVRQQLRDLVGDQEPSYFANSYKLYQSMMEQDSCDYILQRQLSLTESSKKFLDGRIKRYGDWHHCGMILRPGLEQYINSLVALDPLYIVDTDRALLTPAMSRFNPIYQQRLRPYVIQESLDNTMLDVFPDEQFAFILAFNYFNYKPLELTRRLLLELYGKLRSGGVVAFTFNDCDRSGAIDLVERNFMCYTPGRLLLSAAETMGYQIHEIYRIDAACTWVELMRPGTLTSLRGGQSLAKIIAKSK